MKHRRLTLSLLASAVLAGCALPGAGTPGAASAGPDVRAQQRSARQWKDEVVYFAFLDRFSNGDRTNDHHVDRANPTAYHGGDLQGLIDKLDYLSDLGVTTLWLSPLLDNDDDQLKKTGLWGYHGYWTKDFSAIDEHLGTLEKAQELTTKAHRKGMKVLLDVVCNQAGYSFPVQNPRYQGFFHSFGDIQNWDDPWWCENGSLFGLPDFAQEKPEVSKFLVDTYLGWAEKLDLDGFRIDALKHAPKGFWKELNASSHAARGQGFMTLGEILHGDPGVVASYQRESKFDSLFDFPLYYTMTDVFAKGASMRRLGDRFAQDALYPDASMLSPFVDNHDVPRFLSQAGGDVSKLKLAVACALTVRGMPMIYYGTEVALGGGAEPDNRRDMTWGANEDMRAYTRQLLSIRKGSTALRRGKQLEMWQDDQVYAYLRQAPDDEAVVALNNDDRSQQRLIPLRAESKLVEGTVLVDRLTGDRVTVKSGKIQVSLGAKQARILCADPAKKR
ncbi:MAG TPA: alpha-amylase family glycosyl hydrolase [Pantanalinema sp.]